MAYQHTLGLVLNVDLGPRVVLGIGVALQQGGDGGAADEPAALDGEGLLLTEHDHGAEGVPEGTHTHAHTHARSPQLRG